MALSFGSAKAYFEFKRNESVEEIVCYFRIDNLQMGNITETDDLSWTSQKLHITFPC